MSRFIIYSSSGVARSEVDDIELHEEWMAECFLSVSVKSPDPVDFVIGDYIMYRGEKYVINYDPTVLKKARRGTYGEGFVYDNIKFVSEPQSKVVGCDFTDLVLNDNQMHYTAMPTFPFYCESVDDLLDRVQACLEELYPGEFILIGLNTTRNAQRGLAVGRQQAFIDAYKQYVDPSGTARTDPYGKQSVALSVDNITCWEAVTKIHSDFDLNFIQRGSVIIAGINGVFTSSTFRYGKGNGLYEIERIADSSQQIVTRLKAYGSGTNLPVRYYAELNLQVFGNVERLDANYAKTGSHYAAFTLDIDFSASLFKNRSKSYPGNSERPNFIVRLTTSGITVTGYVTKDASSNRCYFYCEYGNGVEDDRDETDRAAMDAFSEAIALGDRVDIVAGAEKSAFPESHKDYATENLPNNMAISRLMLPGFPNQSLYDWVRDNGGTNFDDATGRATINGFTGYFSKDRLRPWIQSLNSADYGVRPGNIYFDGSDDTEDIHPTLEGVTISGVPVDKVYACDQITDNGVFSSESKVPNFKITLPNLGFDLAEYYQDDTTIEMKDGMCGARSFKLASRPIQKQDGRWECTVEREHDEALDLWFPYCDFQISAGDSYVLTGIELPDFYVSKASERMFFASLDAIQKNDTTRFTYQPRIDELWMARQHDGALPGTSLHDTLHAGDVFLFGDDDLGIDEGIIIDVLSIRENGNNGLPTYEVTLRDEKQVSTIQRMIDKAASSQMAGNGSGGGLTSRQVQSLIDNYGGDRFLSKINDDEAEGFIRFLEGLQVGNQFISGLLGEGGVFRKDADGKVYIEADKLYVRMKAYFDNVEIKDYEHTSGNRIASKAGLKCVKVEAYNANDVLLATNPQSEPTGTSYYRLYFRAKDGEDAINNDFVNGDQAFCDKTTYDNNIISHHRYWRLVVGKNGNLSDSDEFGFIDLSASDKESGSDVPQAGDDVSQLGNRTNIERQGAIIEFVGGDNAPAYQIYQGINTYSLSGKCMIDMGFDSQTGLARMNVAGNFRFGSPLNTGSYIKYDSQANQGQGELKIKAHVEFTNSDAELDALVQEHQTTYDDSEVWAEMDNLQDQIDGAIESWFLTGVPTLQNAPANTWTTDAEKNNHIGDLYYDKATGHGYRFMFDNEEEVYLWTPIADEDIARALRNAAKAQETADGKRTVYSAWNAWVKDNVNTLEVGDLFIPAANTTQGGVTYKANKVYKCITKGSAVFQAADYVDDAQAQAKVDAFVSGTYATDKQNLQSQIDGKAETYRQATDPALSWTDADKPKHVGDLWMDISSDGGKKTKIYEDKGASASPRYKWEEQDVPDAVFDEIDGKSTIYGNAIATPPTNYKKDDMWLLPADATINGVSYKAGDVLSASQDSATYSATHWSKRVRYTDDTRVEGFITELLNGSSDTEGAMTAAIKAIRAAMNNGVTSISGGLVLSNQIMMRDTAAIPNTWSGISGMFNSTARGNGVAIWAGGAGGDWESYYDSLTPEQQQSAAITSAYGKSLFRFDGSGYLAGGNITWDATGRVTIKDLHTDDGGTPTDVLQEMSAFREMFDLSVWASATRIKPLQNFEHLKITRPNEYTVDNNDVLTRSESDARYTMADRFKARFKALFRVYNGNSDITDSFFTNGLPSDTSNVSIKAMFDFWSQGGITALGQGSQGGGGGGSTTLYGLNDVSKNAAGDGVLGAADGYVLTYNATTNHWYAAPTAPIYSAGTGLALSSNTFSINSTYQTYISHGESAYNSLSSYLPLSGGTLTGGLTISNGSDLNLQAVQGSADCGDIVFKDGSGNEVGRFWKQDSANIFYVRFDDGVAHSIVHSGNIGSQSVNYASSAGNADTVDGYNAYAGINNPYGTIPVITASGWMDVGKQFEFHYDNTTGSDYSTLLRCTGNYDNVVDLPSSSGTLALTSQIPTNNNQLTNGAGYITSSGSCAYAGYSGYTTGYANYLTSQGTVVAASGTGRYGEGLRIGRVYGEGHPVTYGTTLTMEASNFGAELIFNGIGGGGATGSGQAMFRTHSDWDTSEWGEWRTIIDSVNIGSQSVSYANSAGNADTLDGVHNGDVTAQYFSVGKTLTNADTLNTLLSGVYCYMDGNNPTGSVGDNCVFLGFRNNPRTDTLQIVGAGNEKQLYYRIASNVGNSYETWSSWKVVIDSDNIGSQSVNYANSAGNADTIDNYHAYQLLPHAIKRSDNDSIYSLRYNHGEFDKGDFGGTYASEYPYNFGVYISLCGGSNNNAALMFFECDTSNALGHISVCTRGAGDWNTSYSTWGTLAYISDNVASATQLQTSRSLWGNSFNGTADVTGGLTVLGQTNQFGRGTGATEINYNTYSLYVGTETSRTATPGYYTSGVAFTSMMKYGGVDNFINSPQAWIGLRLVDFPGSERADLVFATKEGSGTSNTGTDIPTERMCISCLGNVGIGTTNPSYKLHVGGDIYSSTGAYLGGVRVGINSSGNYDSNACIELMSGSGYIDWHYDGSSSDYTTRLIENASGQLYLYGNFVVSGVTTFESNVGIGTTSPSYKLHVAGDIYATGGVTSLSDARHKTIMGDTKLRVEQIAEMPAITYKWNDRRDNDLHVGSIAQNWQRILPEVVSVANDLEGTLSINYGVAAMIASIVTAKKVVDHEARIKALESENSDLKQALSFVKNAYDDLKSKYGELISKIA